MAHGIRYESTMPNGSVITHRGVVKVPRGTTEVIHEYHEADGSITCRTTYPATECVCGLNDLVWDADQ
jgi:hypothetical protein